MQPPYRIKQAFLHLAFSVKLFEFFRKGLVDKDAFDCLVDIRTPQGRYRIEAGTFKTERDLVLAAENSYSAALGVCAIAMETALTDAGVKNDPRDVSTRGQLRSFVYQLRNAFAHDSMTPSWSVKGAYRRVFDLRPFGVSEPVDLATLDGQALDLDQFGGMGAFESIRDAVVRWVVAGDPLAPREA